MKRRCKQTRLVLYAGMVMLMMGLGATGFAAPALAADKPNILVIFGDDVGMWNVGAYTNGMMGRTPNIDRIAKEELLKGKKIGGMTYKVYLDGYNNLDLWTGKSKKSARNRYFYYDESDLTGVRVGDWKMPFAVKEDGLWWDPLVYPRVPYLFNLRMDPMELFDPHSPEWGYMGRKIFTEKLWTLIPAQGIIAEHIKSLQEWPPRQRAESLSMQKAMETVMQAIERAPGGMQKPGRHVMGIFRHSFLLAVL